MFTLTTHHPDPAKENLHKSRSSFGQKLASYPSIHTEVVVLSDFSALISVKDMFNIMHCFQLHTTATDFDTFYRIFHAHATRDAKFGAPDGVPNKAEKIACIEQAATDVLDCLTTLTFNFQNRLLFYARWYREMHEAALAVSYSKYITLVTCDNIMANGFSCEGAWLARMPLIEF